MQIDTSAIALSGYDFNAIQLEAVAKSPEAVNAAADEIMENAGSRKGILIFGSGKEHCRMLRDAMRERGVSAEAVFGDTPTQERNATVAMFKQQKIRCLVSLRVFTTGFNAKHVDLLAIVNATKSTGLYVQIVGRGTRLFRGKENCLILDFGGNIDRHGPVDALKEKKEKKKKDEPGVAPEKVCPDCGQGNPISARDCFCGYHFPEAQTIVHTQAAALDIISGRTDLSPQWIDVTGVSYARHTKEGSPDSLRVTYQCGLLQHREWICLEHQGGIKNKAISWWSRRTGNNNRHYPSDITEALGLTGNLLMPYQIAVRPSGKYTEIVGHKFAEVGKVAA
jgi:DNA repair protein RadD